MQHPLCIFTFVTFVTVLNITFDLKETELKHLCPYSTSERTDPIRRVTLVTCNLKFTFQCLEKLKLNQNNWKFVLTCLYSNQMLFLPKKKTYIQWGCTFVIKRKNVQILAIHVLKFKRWFRFIIIHIMYLKTVCLNFTRLFILNLFFFKKE